MTQICPTCGQPVPEPSAGQPAQPSQPPAPPGSPLRRFATVKVAAIAGAAVVILGVGYLLFGRGQPLAERLYSDQPAVREAALAELGALEAANRAPIVELLVKNASDPDPRKLPCTLEALIRLKLPADDARGVLPGLRTLMRGPDSPTAMLALAAARCVAPARPEVQAAALDVITSQGPRLSSTAFLAVLGGISQSLSSTGEAVPGLPAALGSLVMSTADAAVRSSALGVIGQLSSTAQVEAGMVVALGAFSSTAILQGLQDPNPANRMALQGSLMRIIPKDFDLAPQLSALSRDPSPVLRTMAVEVLMSLSPTSTTGWAAVTASLKDGTAEVRRATVLAVKPRAKELPRMAVTSLIALLKDPDETVRGEAAAVLETLPSPRVKKALVAYTQAKAAAEAPVTEAAPADGSPAAGAPAETATTPAAPADGSPAAGAPAETAATPAAPAGSATTETASTPAAPADAIPTEPAPAEATPAEATPATASPDDASKACKTTPEQATTIAKDHTPRSYREGACKDPLEFSVKKSALDPCLYTVTASCGGEAVGTCEVDGNTGDYSWSQ